ncbi:hypothetical protein Ddc_03817 [Ditylenchus destructor]|nr:hypothetical protein Ddc_03817 [Ditylenchus destructor]
MSLLPAEYERCTSICILVPSPHKFYKNGDKHICRGGFAYAFDSEIHSQKSNSDDQWRAPYHCLMSAHYLSNCRSRIRTTGKWEVDDRGRKYQWGIFRKYNHNHEPNYLDPRCSTSQNRLAIIKDEELERRLFSRLSEDFSDESIDHAPLTLEEVAQIPADERIHYDKFVATDKYLSTEPVKEMMRRDSFSIKRSFNGLQRLCQQLRGNILLVHHKPSREVGIVTKESEYKLLGNVRLSELDLLFITGPECSRRQQLADSFLSRFSPISKCSVPFNNIRSLLHFITQATPTHTPDDQYENRLRTASENLLSSRGNAGRFEHLDFRLELLGQNIDLFCCSILPCLDFSEWTSKSIKLLLFDLCQIYLDKLTGYSKANVSTSIETIIQSLRAEVKAQVLRKLSRCIAKLHHNMDQLLGSAFEILQMLTRFKFFDGGHCLRAVHLVFKKALDTIDNENENLMDSKRMRVEEDSMETNYDDLREVKATFALLPRFFCALLEKPAELYLATQLLDLCVQSNTLRGYDLETLNDLKKTISETMSHLKGTSRLNDIVISAASDTEHKIKMAIIKRKTTLNDFNDDSIDEIFVNL